MNRVINLLERKKKENTPIEKSFYLVAEAGIGNGYGPSLSVRTTVNRPALGQHEIAFKVNLSLPADLFLRPLLEMNIQASPGGEPVDIDVDGIKQAVESVTGCIVTVGESE